MLKRDTRATSSDPVGRIAVKIGRRAAARGRIRLGAAALTLAARRGAASTEERLRLATMLHRLGRDEAALQHLRALAEEVPEAGARVRETERAARLRPQLGVPRLGPRDPARLRPPRQAAARFAAGERAEALRQLAAWLATPVPRGAGEGPLPLPAVTAPDRDLSLDPERERLLATALAAPAQPKAWMALARHAREAGDWNAAYLAAVEALAAAPTWESTPWFLADCLSQLGQGPAALALLRELGLLPSDDVRANLRRARIAARDGQHEEALAAARDALAAQPSLPGALAIEVQELITLGRREEANRVIAQARAAGLRPEAAVAVARVLLAQDDPAAARAVLDAVDARDAAVLGLCAEAINRLGRYGEGAEQARAALALDEAEPSARRALAVAEGFLEATTPGWLPPIRPITRGTPARGRILHLFQSSPPHHQAGYTVRAHNVLRGQREAGLDPYAVTRLGFPANVGVLEFADVEEVDGFRYHRLRQPEDLEPGLDRMLAAYAEGIAPLVEELRPAALQPASSFHNALVALAVREVTGIPVVYEVRGFQEESWAARMGPGAEETDSYLRRRAVEVWCMGRADRVVTLAEVMRSEIVGQGVAAERVVLVPNAVDVDRFVPRGRDAGLAARWGIAPGEVVVGYVSSFSGYEGIGFLIEAVAVLAGRGLPVRLLLVGDGPERARLEGLARGLGVADRVVFTGRVAHARVVDYYGLLDVFVVPRTADRVSRLVTPLKPFEAMAMGLAVVVSDTPALREVVADGVTGLVAPPEDARALAGVVERLAVDAGLRARLGAAARAWVAAERTWAANGRRYRALYEDLGAA